METPYGTEMMQVTLFRTLASFPNPNVLVVISKDVWAVGSRTLNQRNPPFLKCVCRLMQVNLYIGCKTVV